jgi:hypothetical protein
VPSRGCRSIHRKRIEAALSHDEDPALDGDRCLETIDRGKLFAAAVEDRHAGVTVVAAQLVVAACADVPHDRAGLAIRVVTIGEPWPLGLADLPCGIRQGSPSIGGSVRRTYFTSTLRAGEIAL